MAAGKAAGQAEGGKGLRVAVAYASDKRFLGRWVYTGNRGRTEYLVGQREAGGLFFEGPDGRGRVVSGVLQKEGPWLQAELTSKKGGRAAGTVRLAILEERRGLLSNFRRSADAKWGRNIVAQPVASEASRCPVAAAEPEGAGLTRYDGCIPAGGDILVLEMTVAEAKVQCRRMVECQGFCFKGRPDNEGALVKVYFKSKWALVPRPDDGSTWTSYRFDGPLESVPPAPPAEAPQALEEGEEEEEEDVGDMNIIHGRFCPWDAQGPQLRLTNVAVAQFWRYGFLGPMRALTPAELRCCREGLRRFADDHCGGIVDNASSVLNHVTLPWLFDLARHPRVLAAVASVLRSDDVLLYNSCMFLRNPGRSCKQELGVGWHEDGWLYDKVLTPMDDWVTAFVALSSCRQADGCLQYVPVRMIRGPGTEDRKFPFMELGPGEFSLHSAWVTHRAGMNGTSQRRDCLALRYISGRMRDKVLEKHPEADKDWVVLCSGRDTEHFRPLPRPEVELGDGETELKASVASLRAARYGATRF